MGEPAGVLRLHKGRRLDEAARSAAIKAAELPYPRDVTPFEIVAIVAAGLAAGTVNTIVGSGSLITFPTLLAFGFPPLVANVSNNIGLVPGAVSGTIGYRRELAGQRSRVLRLGLVSGLGGLTGAVLLLALPATAFARIVPILVLFAVVLVALQPRLTRYMAARRAARAAAGAGPEREHSLGLLAGMFFAGIYGGYFGAAQGVIQVALLGIFVSESLQRLNAVKNVNTAVVNGVAAVLFAILAPVDWTVVFLLAIGSTVGGQIGAYVGRRLSPLALRGAIIVIGTVVGVRLLIG
jgi:uncharacterized membrane protein YfcA